jgi:hypothetical protein
VVSFMPIIYQQANNKEMRNNFSKNVYYKWFVLLDF